VTGIATAYLDSVPIVAITGNVATKLIGRDSFQEVNIVGITMPITKHNYIVQSVNELQRVIREAFYIAGEGRPGPVLIDIPKDIQQAVVEYDPDAVFEFGRRATPPEYDLKKAVEMLKNAERPFIYAGGGAVISGAGEELSAFAEAIDAPVATSLMGMTVISSEHPSALGMIGMHGRYAASKALSECDLLIAAGVRFSDRATGKKDKFAKNCKILQLDVDRAEINKNIRADEFIIGGIKPVLAALLAELPKIENKKWRGRIAELKACPENALADSGNALTPKFIIQSARQILGRGGLTAVATDVGQHQMWTAQYYGFERPRTFVTSGGLGAMGFGMGAAIGASIGSGKKPSILFTSDGSFHMNMNELATAVSNDLPVTVIVLDNNALGMVRQWQTMFYGKRYSETTLCRKTDYVALAEAFGARGFRAKTRAELTAAMSLAAEEASPCLIHCVVDCDEKVFPMIPPNGTVEDIIIR
ncbi:MAG: biosynthetic-type acetolactate synthase large subunit, partial [Clostridiales bacterium]|nr:biosynthetic-type acetolactate synthase large subunit [Clostridiales bacterium]